MNLADRTALLTTPNLSSHDDGGLSFSAGRPCSGQRMGYLGRAYLLSPPRAGAEQTGAVKGQWLLTLLLWSRSKAIMVNLDFKGTVTRCLTECQEGPKVSHRFTPPVTRPSVHSLWCEWKNFTSSVQEATQAQSPTSSSSK